MSSRSARLPLPTLLLCSALAAAPCAAKTRLLRFSGKQLYEKRTGTTVLFDDFREHLFLSSSFHHYWLVLPYSETWTFETGRQLPLLARSDRFRVEVATDVRPAGQVAEARLRATAEALAAAGAESVALVEAHDRPILRYRSACDATASWHYRTAVARDRSWYVLRICFADPGQRDRAELEELLLDILGVGFGADFEAVAP